MSVSALYVVVEGKEISMDREHCWSVVPWGRYSYSGKDMSECHLFGRKSHSNRPGKESGGPR
jgi:hypothetical protein